MGNHLFYSSDRWKEIRQKTLGNCSECEKCGSKNELTVHHRSYNNFGGNETAEDLEVLCWDCHRDAHETEEKYWVHLVNAIESIEEAISGNDSGAFNLLNLEPYNGIQDKANYLKSLYDYIAKRKEAFGSNEYMGIHECLICINYLDKYPHCKKPRKYGCVPLK